jgi:hypothetical protein
MNTITTWLAAHPEAAIIFLAPLWSGLLHGAGKVATAHSFPKLGSLLHWLAMRTPPTTKADALQLAKETAEEAAKP